MIYGVLTIPGGLSDFDRGRGRGSKLYDAGLGAWAKHWRGPTQVGAVKLAENVIGKGRENLHFGSQNFGIKMYQRDIKSFDFLDIP